MKRLALAIAATAVLAAACYEYTGPQTEPTQDTQLTGTFAWVRPGAPGLPEYDTASLSADRGTITGLGHAYWWTPAGTTVMSFSVSGDYSDTTQSFEMWIIYPSDSYRDRDFVAQAWGWDSLSGSWTDESYLPSAPYHGSIARTAAPLCGNPAKQVNDGSDLGLVQLHDGVNPVTESQRLAGRYGFTVRFVDQAPGFNGFDAYMSPGVVGMLLCEPSVASVEHG